MQGLVCYVPVLQGSLVCRALECRNSEEKVGCGLQSGILDFLLMETEGSLVILTVSVAIFPLVFLFIVLCGGGIEAQVFT